MTGVGRVAAVAVAATDVETVAVTIQGVSTMEPCVSSFVSSAVVICLAGV